MTPPPLVTHLGFLAGLGPSQAFDFVLMFRERLQGQPPEVVEGVAARIASADFAEVELIRRGKKNFVMKRYPGLDHRFSACPRAEAARCGAAQNHFDQVLDDFFKWVEREP